VARSSRRSEIAESEVDGARISKVERRRDRRQQLGLVADRGKLDEDEVTTSCRRLARGRLHGESCLADSARAREGQKARAVQESSNALELPLPAHEARPPGHQGRQSKTTCGPKCAAP
jgi:hypothetical protein